MEDAQTCGDDAADEIMERIVRSATQGPGTRAQPRERRRSRANRKSRRFEQMREGKMSSTSVGVGTEIDAGKSRQKPEKGLEPAG